MSAKNMQLHSLLQFLNNMDNSDCILQHSIAILNSILLKNEVSYEELCENHVQLNSLIFNKMESFNYNLYKNEAFTKYILEHSDSYYRMCNLFVPEDLAEALFKKEGHEYLMVYGEHIKPCNLENIPDHLNNVRFFETVLRNISPEFYENEVFKKYVINFILNIKSDEKIDCDRKFVLNYILPWLYKLQVEVELFSKILKATILGHKVQNMNIRAYNEYSVICEEFPNRVINLHSLPTINTPYIKDGIDFVGETNLLHSNVVYNGNSSFTFVEYLLSNNKDYINLYCNANKLSNLIAIIPKDLLDSFSGNELAERILKLPTYVALKKIITNSVDMVNEGIFTFYYNIIKKIIKHANFLPVECLEILLHKNVEAFDDKFDIIDILGFIDIETHHDTLNRIIADKYNDKGQLFYKSLFDLYRGIVTKDSLSIVKKLKGMENIHDIIIKNVYEIYKMADCKEEIDIFDHRLSNDFTFPFMLTPGYPFVLDEDTNISTVYNCGNNKRKIYISLAEINSYCHVTKSCDNMSINIGCFTGNKVNAYANIYREYTDDIYMRDAYIKKVDLCYEMACKCIELNYDLFFTKVVNGMKYCEIEFD